MLDTGGSAATAVSAGEFGQAPPPATPGPVTVEWRQSIDHIDDLAAEWRELEARVQQRTHLPMFDFIGTWYRHYAGEYGGAPLLGLARRGGRLVGVAPLAVRRGSIGRIPTTRVEFAPTDVPAGEFLIEDDQPEVASAFIESLAETARFDVICLDGVDPDSDQLRAVRETAARRGIGIETDDHAYAFVDLRNGYKSYYATLSGHYRRNLGQKARKIAAAGAEVGGVMFSGTDAQVEEAIERMIVITEASYKLEGHRLADNHRNFLADVIRRLAGRGMLCLPLLKIGGKDAAFIIGVVERQRFYDITLAYNESFAKLSPGAYLMQDTLERLAAAGVHTAISHGAHEYKKHWATAFVPQTRVFLFASNVRALATRVVRFRLAPLWQRLRPAETAHE